MSDMRRMMMMFTRPVDSGGEVEVPAPIILPASGNISPSQTISITISGIAVGAEYSTDNVNWVAYTAPFTLSSNTTVYARALDADGNYSSIVNNSYIMAPYDAQVEYLQSSGTQWIDTKFYAVGGNIQHYKARFDSSGTSLVLSIDRTISSNYDRNLFAFTRGYADFEKLNYYADRTPAYYTKYTYQQGTDYEIYYDNRGTSLIGKINGETLTNTSLSGTLRGSKSVKIFRSDYSGALRVGRIYWLKLYDSNGILSRDFVPVRLGNVGYLFDKISGELFGNSGSGSFSYGSDVIN